MEMPLNFNVTNLIDRLGTDGTRRVLFALNRDCTSSIQELDNALIIDDEQAARRVAHKCVGIYQQFLIKDPPIELVDDRYLDWRMESARVANVLKQIQIRVEYLLNQLDGLV